MADLDVDEFIDFVFSDAYLSAVSDTIASITDPPGRTPRPEWVKLHEWFNGLTDYDRSMLESALQESAFTAIFGILCMLDNVRVVRDGGRERLQLNVVDEAGVEQALDPLHQEFHASFRWKVDHERSEADGS